MTNISRWSPTISTWFSLLLGTFWLSGNGPAAAAEAPTATDSAVREVHQFKLGGAGGWDYLTLDAAHSRLFIARSDRVMVVDPRDGSQIGTVADTPGVHGVALAPDRGVGFTSNGRSDTVTVFDLGTLAPRATWKAGGQNPDAILYEPASRRLLTFNGRSNDISVLDPDTGKVLAVLPAGGKPEFAATDGQGRVYVNIQDTARLLEIDARGLRVINDWPLPGCEEPTGLAIDIAHKRLFSVCGNEVMVVTDGSSGRQLARLPIGAGADAAAFDPATGLAYSSNGQSGNVTIVQAADADHFTVVGNVPTYRSARTMALDPVSHRIYLVAADFGPAPEPTAQQPHPRPPVLEGSFRLLELAP